MRARESARERLLSAADELFYAEGVHTVGIDRVIERAGVAKASLYSSFGSKEDLVLAYLSLRAERRQRRILERLAEHDTPRARILAVFQLLSEIAREPDFRGCAFANASAEGPAGDSKVQQLCIDSRAWTRLLFVDLAREAGAPDPEQLGHELKLLYSGAVACASADRDPEAADVARRLAEQLLDRTLPAPGASQPPARTQRAKRSGVRRSRSSVTRP